MEQPTADGSPRHWSVHPAKLTAAVAVVTAVLAAAQMGLVLALLHGGLASEADPPATLLAWSELPYLLVLAGWATLSAVVLRAQARQGLTDRAKNRISWAALPGLVVVLALLAVSLWSLRYPDSRVEYTLNIASSTLVSLLVAALPVVVAALLIPTLRSRCGLTIGTLIAAAVMLLPSLTQQLLLAVLGNKVQLGLWAAFTPPQYVAYALVAVALLQLVRLRLWDALALQWGIYAAISALNGRWAAATLSAPQWLVNAHRLILWTLPALASLYCLLMWDRGISPARPFVALANRVKALASHFLPT